MSMDREFRSRSPHPGKMSPEMVAGAQGFSRTQSPSRNLATASPLAYGAGASAGRTHASWASDPSCPLGNVTLRALGPGSRLCLPRAPSPGGGSRSWAWGLPLLRPSLWFNRPRVRRARLRSTLAGEGCAAPGSLHVPLRLPRTGPDSPPPARPPAARPTECESSVSSSRSVCRRHPPRPREGESLSLEAVCL